MAWGADAKSCDSLLSRVERNDSALKELFILPTKTFGDAELDRLSRIFEQGCNSTLKSLSASGKMVSSESMFRLGRSIAKAAASENCTALSSLAVGDSSLGDEGIQAFCRGVREGGGKTALEAVDFSMKGIGLRGFADLLDTFAEDCSPKLRSMNVSRNEVLSRDESKLDTALPGTPNIAQWRHVEDLHLSQCNIGGKALAGLFASSSGCSGLKWKKLRLGNNQLGLCGLDSLLSHLNHSSLQELHMPSCQMGDESIEQLASLSLGQLRIWDLSHNNLTSKGISSFSRILVTKSLPHLVELNLTGNAIGLKGVTELAKALQSRKRKSELSSLETLDLTETNCGVDGASAMIRFGGLTSSLRLFNNQLGSDGFRDLAATLRGGHPELEYLDLGGNGADQAAVVVLLSALLQSSPNVSREDKQVCIHSGGAQNKLKVLVVGGNEAGVAVEQIVAKIREVHPLLDIARQKK